jgi:hypothetical protein
MTKTKGKAGPGRPRKDAGDGVDHRVTPKMESAIRGIVEDNLSRAEAAKLAGLSDEAVRKAIRENPAVRALYSAALKELREFAKAKALHTLINECDGPNASARVAAARTLLEENATATPGNGMAQIPGFTIQIINTRASQQPMPIDVTPLNGVAIAHKSDRRQSDGSES